jgi:hypothetical protein
MVGEEPETQARSFVWAWGAVGPASVLITVRSPGRRAACLEALAGALQYLVSVEVDPRIGAF